MMKQAEGIGLENVQGVYSGPEGELWELLMGEQIHIGGFASSMDLADQAGIKGMAHGVDLNCCTGAGMRFLVRFRDVQRMTGVDVTPRMVEWGRQRVEEEGLADRITFVRADSCETGLDEGCADFVWGEDAWCYTVDKPALIAEAARLTAPGGTVAFTDWVEGPTGLSDEEADRFMRFMKFPNFESIDGYAELLQGNGLNVERAEDTGRYAPHVDLYINMVNMQLTYDTLKIIGFDTDALGAIGEEMKFLQSLAHAGKVAQGLFVARKS
jgi:SAM-dependent methyltransferase